MFYNIYVLLYYIISIRCVYIGLLSGLLNILSHPDCKHQKQWTLEGILQKSVFETSIVNWPLVFGMRLAWCLPSRWILDASWEEKKWWYPSTVQDRTRQWWFASRICFFSLFCSPCMLSLMIVVFCCCAVRTSIDRIWSQYRKILFIHQAKTVVHMNHWYEDTVNGRNPAPVDMVNIIKYPIFYRVLYIPSPKWWRISSINSMEVSFHLGGCTDVFYRSISWCAQGSSGTRRGAHEMRHSIWPPKFWPKIDGKLGLSPL